VAKSAKKLIPFPPNNANYNAISKAHSAATKPLVIPSIPNPLAILIYVITNLPKVGLITPD